MGMHWVIIMINHIHIFRLKEWSIFFQISSFTMTIHKISTSYPDF